MKRPTWLFSVLFGMALPGAFVLQFILDNGSYPRTDGAYFFLASQKIYLTFQRLGLGEALYDATITKSWKPILHPVISSFFLFLSGGSVVLATKTALIFWYVLFLYYVGRIATSMLPWPTSCISIFLIGTTTWVFNSAVNATSEMPIMASTLGAFYHLMNLKDFSSRQHSLKFGFWMGIAICIRPVEAIFTFIVPIFAVFRTTYAVKAISSELYYALVFAGLMFVSLAIPVYRHAEWKDLSLNLILGSSVLAGIGLHLKGMRSNWNMNFTHATAIMLLIPFAWFAPSTLLLFNWIMECNFSDWGALLGGRQSTTILQFFVASIRNLGILAWILVVIAASSGRASFFKTLKSHHVGLAIGMLILPLMAGAITSNGNPRYYYSGNLILILCAGAAALSPIGKFFEIRKVAVMILAGLQFFVFVNSTRHCIDDSTGLQLLVGRQAWKYRLETKDPHLELHQELMKIIPPSQTAKFAILPLCPIHLGALSDAAVLELRSNELGVPWTFLRFQAEQNLLMDVPKVITKHYNYVLLGPLSGTVDCANFGPVASMAKDFITTPELTGKLGWTSLGQIEVFESGKVEKFKVYKTSPQIQPKRNNLPGAGSIPTKVYTSSLEPLVLSEILPKN